MKKNTAHVVPKEGCMEDGLYMCRETLVYSKIIPWEKTFQLSTPNAECFIVTDLD